MAGRRRRARTRSTLPCPRRVYRPERPVHASDGSAVVGGYVYRGSEIPALQGMYVFGDLSANLNFQNPVGRAALFYLDPEASRLSRFGDGSGQPAHRGWAGVSEGLRPGLLRRALRAGLHGSRAIRIRWHGCEDRAEPSSLTALLALGAPWAVLLRRNQRGWDG